MLELRRGPRAEDRRALPSAPAPLHASDLYLAGGVRPPAFRPRKDRPSWRLTIPLDWAADPFTDENGRFHLHAWRMMDPLVRLWFRDRDPALLCEMFDYPRDWLRFHRAGGSCPVSWNDMLSGVRAFRLAFLLERRRSGDLLLEAGDDAVLLDLVDSHAEFLSRRKNVPHSNHGLIQAVGYRQLGDPVRIRPGPRPHRRRSVHPRRPGETRPLVRSPAHAMARELRLLRPSGCLSGGVGRPPESAAVRSRAAPGVRRDLP